MNTRNKTNRLVKIALLVGIAYLLSFIKIPIIPIAPWLKIDISDVPLLMGAFAFGPVTGVVLLFVKGIMDLLLGGSGTGGVGELANFMIGLSLILPASFIYHRNKSKKTAVIGMIVGTLLMLVVGILANVYILLPLYGMHMKGAKLTEYIVVGLVPFNLIKGTLVSAVTYGLYKKLSYSIFKVDPKFNTTKKDIEENLAS